MRLTPAEMTKHVLYLSMKSYARLTVALRNQARLLEAVGLEEPGEAAGAIDAEAKQAERKLFEQIFGDDDESTGGPDLPILPRNGQP